VLAAVFDHTVWIRARQWHAEQDEKDQQDSKAGPQASATKRWLKDGRARIEEKYAGKLERLRAAQNGA
jgi:hypothetical protein